MDIFNEAKLLQNSSSINSFIKKRLSEIKHNDEREIGMVARDTTYSRLLTKKIQINTYTTTVRIGASLFATTPGSFKMDDNKIYKYLIEEIHNCDDPYTAVYRAARRYSFPKKYTARREKCSHFVHRNLATAIDKPLSIKIYHSTKLSLCPQISAVVHNMFIFLGIDADYVACGFNTQDDVGFHSFNIIYPFGRNKEAFIFDAVIRNEKNPPIFYVNEKQRKRLMSHKYAFFNGQDVDEANKMLLGKNIVSEYPSCTYVVLEDGWAETLLEYDKAIKAHKRLSLERE